MAKQKVHGPSRTQSGIPGLFTGNYCAWPITEEQFELFTKDREVLKQYVARLGWELEEVDNGRGD
jgi:hypothetical protein